MIFLLDTTTFSDLMRGSPRAETYLSQVPPIDRIKTAACAKGLPLGENDLWIAATALALGATLVTRDSDYAGVDGLLLADWSR